MMMGGMTLGVLFLLLLVVGVPLVLLGGGVLLLVNRSGSGNGGSPRRAGDTPRAILDQRLARGEIDADEYHRILSEIKDGGAE